MIAKHISTTARSRRLSKIAWRQCSIPGLIAATLLCSGLIAQAQSETSQSSGLSIPQNIETRNVPQISAVVGERLQRYNHTRSASVLGWQGDQLLISTRFGETSQLHRVNKPLGFRQQLTYLPEPLADVAIPKGGAKNQIIISWDVGGSEFDQLFLFDLNDGSAKMVSDGHSLYSDTYFSPDEKSFVYVTTERNGRNWDIHRQDMQGNVEILLETEEGYWYPLDWSADGTRLLVKHRLSINESSIYELDIASKKMSPIYFSDEPPQDAAGIAAGPAQKRSIGGAKFDGEGGIFFTSDHGSQVLRLHHLDQATGRLSTLTKNVPWNVEGFVLSPDYKTLAYAVNNNGYSELVLWSVSRQKKIDLPSLPTGIVRSLVFNPSGEKLAVTLNSPTSPSDAYVIDLAGSKVERWTQSEVGGLDIDQFVEAQLFHFPTFDQREIPAFVYRPTTPGPHPVVVYIHGGPESQYRPYFSTLMQSYVNEMNVAVIAPNVRGSNGYGKDYLKLDNAELRENSVKDIGALLDWIDRQEDLRSDRVAVMGGSYGGYMVLASMVHYGPRLSAAVESVGISNFVTFLENTQAYRQDMRRVEYGDERDPKMRKILQSISPLNHVDRMQTPLLISQGANDPRVPASESEQIHKALENAGVPTWYILARDEGHGFRKKANRDYDRAAKFAFLEKHLKRE